MTRMRSGRRGFFSPPAGEARGRPGWDDKAAGPVMNDARRRRAEAMALKEEG